MRRPAKPLHSRMRVLPMHPAGRYSELRDSCVSRTRPFSRPAHPDRNWNYRRAGSPAILGEKFSSVTATRSRSSSSAPGTAKQVLIFPTPRSGSTAANRFAARSGRPGRSQLGKHGHSTNPAFDDAVLHVSLSKANAPFSLARNRTATCRKFASIWRRSRTSFQRMFRCTTWSPRLR